MSLKVLELFAGIGACSKALTNLGIEHEIVDCVEIDKFAVKSFNAVHGTNFEPQDITKWDKDIECDLIMHGSPCQDFSVAGKQAGGDKDSGTRSSLMYETLRIVEKLKPKYVIWENVKNVISKKHWHNFANYQESMADLGYISTWKVLNAKDYGIPQNRERVFTVSIREDQNWADFSFPEPILLEKRLKDVLEGNVDEKYYLDGKYEKLLMVNDNYGEMIGGTIGKMHDISRRAYSQHYISPTLPTCAGENIQPKIVEPFIVASRGRNPENPSDRTTGSPTEQRLEPKFDGTTNTITTVQKDNYVALPGAYGREFGSKGKIQDLDKESSTLQAAMGEGGGNVPLVPIKSATKAGYDFASDGDGINLQYPTSTTRRGRVGHGVSQTLQTTSTMGTLHNSRIRKLTPKECWRLMGFDDEDFDKAAKVNSNAQLYKQAGNSIVVNVLEAILVCLLKGKQ